MSLFQLEASFITDGIAIWREGKAGQDMVDLVDSCHVIPNFFFNNTARKYCTFGSWCTEQINKKKKLIQKTVKILRLFVGRVHSSVYCVQGFGTHVGVIRILNDKNRK